jgi:hypothetical protein
LFLFRTSTNNSLKEMGAASAKNDGELRSEQQPKPSGFFPFLMDCHMICEPKKTASLPKPKSEGSENMAPNRAFHEPQIDETIPSRRFDKSNSLDSQKSIARIAQAGPSEIQPPVPAPTLASFANPSKLRRSESTISSAKPNRPMTTSSLSFKGSLPPGWGDSDQERLKWAVEETSRRLGIRPPGLRAMQKEMADLVHGASTTGTYDTRSFTLTQGHIGEDPDFRCT